MGVINLSKGSKISLTKNAEPKGEALKTIKCGLKWGPIEEKETITIPASKPGFLGRLFGAKATEEHTETVTVSHRNVDLDASILVYDKNYRQVDQVFFGSKVSKDGSMCTLGDDTTGSSHKGIDRDNETLIINLPKVSENSKYLVIALNSYSHDRFDDLPFAQMNIYSEDGRVFADYRVDNNPEFVNKEALILGVFQRTTGGLWEFKASGKSTRERSITEIAAGSAKEVIRGN